MLKIYGLSEESCFVSGKKEATNVRVRFDDRSFSGVLSIAELVKQIHRRSKKTHETRNVSSTEKGGEQ